MVNKMPNTFIYKPFNEIIVLLVDPIFIDVIKFNLQFH